MEASSLKRIVPYVELIFFMAAWAVGIVLAVQVRPAPQAAAPERKVVASDPSPLPDALRQHRSYRPIVAEEIQEGG